MWVLIVVLCEGLYLNAMCMQSFVPITFKTYDECLIAGSNIIKYRGYFDSKNQKVFSNADQINRFACVELSGK